MKLAGQQISMMDVLRNDNERAVIEIDRSMAKGFVESIHYSRKLPGNVVHSFGLFRGGVLIGVCTYGIPASPPLCKGLAGEKNRDHVLELNRLAILPEWNGGNEASYLVGHSLKMLPRRTFVVSYADTGWSHVGYVYQATNWLYTGMSAKRVDSFCNGLHPRAYNKNNHSSLHQTRNQKHRYVYLVGNKWDKREMLKELKYPIIPEYPKGDEIHYDTKNPKIVIPIQIIGKGSDSGEDPSGD